MTNANKRIVSFLFLAYAISWSIVGLGVALGAGPAQSLGYMFMAGLSMFGPALAAIIQQRSLDHAPWSGLGIGLKGVHWRQVAWTAVVGLVLIPLSLLVAKVFGDGLGIEAFGHVSITQERLLTSVGEMMASSGVKSNTLATMLEGHHLPGALLLVGLALVTLLSACTLNLPVMMGEELGWRGYLFQATAHWSGARRVLFTGFFWGLWHAPLIAMGHNYPEHPMLGIGLMVVFCILLALQFDRARLRSGTTWAAGLLHGCINGSAGGYALFAWGGGSLVNSPVGMAGFIALVVLGIAVIAFDPTYRQRFLTRTTDPVPALPIPD
ncbi:MAG: CPBP family intramembrane metalloprotease [Flavobacteriales bacterium]|nr:CPBP family intramembrane metalloprotease [Flavobacteriales bacterium]